MTKTKESLHNIWGNSVVIHADNKITPTVSLSTLKLIRTVIMLMMTRF